MDLGIEGRCALVTGGSQGIGRACAEALAAEHVSVAIVARDPDRLVETVEAISARNNGRIVPVAADLATAEGVAAAVDEATQALGRIDILVNNAGAAPLGRIDEIDDETWQSCFDLKVMGYVRCARAVLGGMREAGWGRIINIIGRGGHFPTAKYIAGGSMNAALLNFTQALAEEAGPDGVLVNGINPTATATARWSKLVEQRSQMTGETIEEITAVSAFSVPLGRIGEPEDIASMVTFLCSEQASFVNGALIDVDGGQSRAL